MHSWSEPVFAQPLIDPNSSFLLFFPMHLYFSSCLISVINPQDMCFSWKKNICPGVHVGIDFVGNGAASKMKKFIFILLIQHIFYIGILEKCMYECKSKVIDKPCFIIMSYTFHFWALSSLFVACLGRWPTDQLLSVVVFTIGFMDLFLQAWRKHQSNTVFFSDSSLDSSDAETCHWRLNEAVCPGCCISTCKLCHLYACACWLDVSVVLVCICGSLSTLIYGLFYFHSFVFSPIAIA